MTFEEGQEAFPVAHLKYFIAFADLGLHTRTLLVKFLNLYLMVDIPSKNH